MTEAIRIDGAEMIARACSRCGERDVTFPAFAAMYAPMCDACVAADDARIAAEEAVRRANERRSAIQHIVFENPTPRGYAGATLANAVVDPQNAAAISAVRQFIAAISGTPDGVGVNGIGLWSHGNGSGKTHLSWVIANELRARGYGAMVYTVGALIRAITKTFDDDSAKHKHYLMDIVRTCPALVLDDFGKEVAKESQWAAEELFEIVNDRYNSLLPTVFTTNLSPQELLGRAADDKARAIIDRSYSISWVECRGHTRRSVSASWMPTG